MEIAIVGAGVLGSIFGSLFLKSGFDVTLIEVLKERVGLIAKEGLWLQWPDGKRTHSKIPITSQADDIGVVVFSRQGSDFRGPADGGAGAGMFVGGDGHAVGAAADQHAVPAGAGSDRFGDGVGEVGVIDGILALRAVVRHLPSAGGEYLF